jgi:hypothetical protein
MLVENILLYSTLLCLLGDDSYDTCLEKGWRTYSQFNVIHSMHTIKLRDGREVAIHLCEGGDNKYLNGSNGQCGCSAMEGCCYCTSRTSDFHFTWVALRAVNNGCSSGHSSGRWRLRKLSWLDSFSSRTYVHVAQECRKSGGSWADWFRSF